MLSLQPIIFRERRVIFFQGGWALDCITPCTTIWEWSPNYRQMQQLTHILGSLPFFLNITFPLRILFAPESFLHHFFMVLFLSRNATVFTCIQKTQGNRWRYWKTIHIMIEKPKKNISWQNSGPLPKVHSHQTQRGTSRLRNDIPKFCWRYIINPDKA